MYLPSIPVHVVQRGHNRDACFFAEEGFRYYRQVLGEGLKRYGAKLHTYCLMTNHVHLLITPDETDSISRLMQHVGRQYIQYINKTCRRSGTLWEGRRRGGLVGAENYLLSCYRYIEPKPVSACMVERPEDYPWSSYRFKALSEPDNLISPHPLFETLAKDKPERRFVYRDLFRYHLPKKTRSDIAASVSASWILNSGRFKGQVEVYLGVRGQVGWGRPVRS
ncbi:transposase [Marinobacter fonticola]|uniref:transposase n=1 Tax=Marinobacter fonticola TaxID=2603215 RepID=UPI001D0D8348|nr:transposase [Marinobacter fonticola]